MTNTCKCWIASAFFVFVKAKYMRYGHKTAAVALFFAIICAESLQTSSAIFSHGTPTRDAPSAVFGERKISASGALALGNRSTARLETRALSGDGAAADVDAVPAPAAALQWIVSIVAIWLFGLSRLARARNQRAGTPEAGKSSSEKRLELLGRVKSDVLEADSPAYREIVKGYARLKEGKASTAEVDDLRRRARSLISGRDEPGQYELREVRALLEWLDHARTHGRITITVQQLRVRKMGTWDIEFGIGAGNRTAKAKMSVAGIVEVSQCGVTVPWDPSSSIELWMHLSDAGYETCWGYFGPILMASKEVLQDTSELLRVFHAEQFDKDFKVAFSINCNFDEMPGFRADKVRRSSNPAADDSERLAAEVPSGNRGY